MTRRELNLAIFEGSADAVLWQPRLETWIGHHQHKGTLPDRYKDLDYYGIYDALHCSIRYSAAEGLEQYNDPDDVIVTVEQQGIYHITTFTTPSGSIRQVEQDVYEDGELTNRRIKGFPVQTPADMQVAIDLVEREHFRANMQVYQAAADQLGHRGEPTGWFSSSGFTHMIKHLTGLPNAYYLLHDRPDVVEAYLEACDRRDDRQIEVALQLPHRILNFGDHATNEFTPPPILNKYLMPRWQRLSAKLHEHGRFCHTHWDGNSKTMLPYLKDTGLDAVESLTPFPQCDMTLEEIKAAVGDEMIVLDLIPAIHFLPHFTMEEILDLTRRIIDMFAPKLILGISDEISQVGQIEKVEAITELVDEVCGLAE